MYLLIDRFLAFKKACIKKGALLVQNYMGFNPPFYIDGELVFNPSFLDLYKEYSGDYLRQRQSIKDLKKRLEDPNLPLEERKQCTLSLCLHTKEGREMLARAMVEGVRENV